jgi:hypothetical protein
MAMNMQQIRVLYIGDEQSNLLTALNSVITSDQLMVASTTKNALAMYALYMPDVLAIDGTSVVAQAALPHLGAFGTSETPDLMLLLADDQEWRSLNNVILCQLPTNAKRDDIIRTLDQLVTACATFGLPYTA